MSKLGRPTPAPPLPTQAAPLTCCGPPPASPAKRRRPSHLLRATALPAERRRRSSHLLRVATAAVGSPTRASAAISSPARGAASLP
jgi:hypothetical protein